MTDRALIGLGWWGYFICAVIYVFSGIRAGDWVGLSGSAFFLLATLCFMVHFYRSQRNEK